MLGWTQHAAWPAPCPVRRQAAPKGERLPRQQRSGLPKRGRARAQAWDTLTWFAALIGMASYLNKFGFIKWFSDQARARRSRQTVIGP